MWDEQDQVEKSPGLCKAQQRQFAPTGWRYEKIDAERYQDWPNQPGQEDDAHGSLPGHGWVGVIHPHPDIAFHKLLEPSQNGHLRNGKVPFAYLERFPACKDAATVRTLPAAKLTGSHFLL